MILPLFAFAVTAIAPQQDPSQDPAAPATPLQLVLTVKALEFDQGRGGRFPSLSTDGIGNVHICWFANGSEQGKTRLQHTAWNGKTWLDTSTLEQGNNWLVNWADFAKYQQDSSGSAIACWQTFAKDKRGYGLTKKTRSLKNGAWSSAAPLHADQKAVEHGFVSLAALGGNSFFATWLQSTASGPPTQLRYAIQHTDGTASVEYVLDDLVCDCCSTAAIALPDGQVVVAYRNRSEAEVRDLRIVRGDPTDPGSWTEPAAVDKEEWRTQSCPVNGPALANDGNYISLVFYTEGSSGFKQVKYLTSTDGGKSFGLPLPIAGGEDCLGRVSVAQMPNGGPAIVSWLQQKEGSAFWMATAIPRKGRPSAVVEIAQVSGARTDGFLQLAVTQEGALAAWTAKTDQGLAVQTARLLLQSSKE
jgi:hypothetical protein